ncbi:MAG: SDR family NAD(P)-dependent oxidoreductase [Eubacteriales bacterium]|nr:SDR family NAD(P)-dependent oxidoreductase [Eubacteriales bacterium]MDD4390746.1 SDR family NAD(P)-dependent oxidoreductase [Eubacteriales bacterium]
MNNLKKYTVITGASSGIGYETAKAFAARGNNLILAARSMDKLKEIKAEIISEFSELDVVVRKVDLTVAEECFKLYDSLRDYNIETWINNAGVGYYGYIAEQDVAKLQNMMRLNMDSVTILSSLYVRDYRDIEGTQLINLSSSAGYTIVPYDVVYSATKFYVGAFTEGLARELKETGAKMVAKVLAPSATETQFAKVANEIESFDYSKELLRYHKAQEMAGFLMELYDSDFTVGIVERENYRFVLCEPIFAYATPLVKK